MMQGSRGDLERDVESYTCGETPSKMEMHRAPRLENWSVQIKRIGESFALALNGNVYGHSQHAEGSRICTSAVAWFDRHGRFCRTRNRVYALGKSARGDIPIEEV